MRSRMLAAADETAPRGRRAEKSFEKSFERSFERSLDKSADKSADGDGEVEETVDLSAIARALRLRGFQPPARRAGTAGEADL